MPNCYQGTIDKNKTSAGVYLFKVNNGNSRIMSGICTKLTKNTPKQCFGIFKEK